MNKLLPTLIIPALLGLNACTQNAENPKETAEAADVSSEASKESDAQETSAASRGIPPSRASCLPEKRSAAQQGTSREALRST